MDYDNGG
jgi:hypothetical protein